MVQVRRISPEDGVTRVFKGLSGRVQSLESRASGEIVIRETLRTVDPNTGEETILGQLPDGSWGFQEHVNDITPPEMPSTPNVTPTMGGLEVWWDGKQSGGTDQPRDYLATEVEYAPEGTNTWKLGGTFRDANSLVIGNLIIGTTYQVRLISYDKNKNASTPSIIQTGVPVAFVDNTDVEEALAELREADRVNAAASAAAQTKASDADKAAKDAAEQALKAIGAVSGKGRVIYSPTAPTAAEDKNVNNMWIDTSGDVPKNTPYRWDTTTQKWVAITDKVAIDAGVKAGQAEQVANAASAAAASAATKAGDALTAANSKNRLWFQPTAPAGNDHKVGDTWFDEANGNVVNKWNGSAWVSAQDAAIAKADKKASDAATAANTAGSTASAAATAADNAAKAAGAKGKVLIQNATPSAADQLVQNLWIDTTGGANTPKRWNTSTSKWEAVVDKTATDAAIAAVNAKNRADDAFNAATAAATAAGEAQTAANGKNKSWYSATAPQGVNHQQGDTWFDQANGNRPMFWDGAKWVSVQDQIYKTIDEKVDRVTASADGKNSNYYTGTAPVSTTAKPLKDGDTWFDTANGNRVKVWSGGKWNDAVDKLLTDTSAAVTEARSIANGKSTTYWESTAPTNTTARPLVKGDTWFNTSKNYQLSTWTGTAWQLAQDANAALTAANGKNKVSTGTTAPSSPASGDLWVDTANSNQIKIYSGSAWVNYVTPGIITADVGVLGSAVVGSANIADLAVTNAKIADLSVTDAKISALNAGKINAGELDAARIGARSIGVEKLLVSSTDNLISDADFSDPKGVAWGRYSGAYVWDETGGRNGTSSLKIVNSAAQQGKYNVADLPASEDSAYRVGAWIKSSVSIPVKGVALYCRQKTINGGAYTASSVWTNDGVDGRPGALAANTWHWISGIHTTVKNTTALSFGIFSQAVLSTGEFWCDFVSATRAANGSLVVDGSITSNSITTSGLDAGIIKFGEMDGSRIKANSITTDQLMIGATDNLVPNPKMTDNGRGWGTAGGGPGSGYTTDVVFRGMDMSYQLTQKTTIGTLYAPTTGLVPVTPGEAFVSYTSFYATGDAPVSSSGYSLRIYFFDENRKQLAAGGNQTGGAPILGEGVTTLPFNTWVDVGGVQVVAPENAAYMAPRLTIYMATTGTPTSAKYYIGNPRLYRVVGTTMIQNGAITTNHMTVGGIDGKVITANTIKGTQIQAKTISTDNLLITSTDNLIQEADFGAGGTGWSLIAGSTINATGGRNGGPSLKFTASSGNQTVYNRYTAAVEPGNVYRLTAWIKPSMALAANTFTFMCVSSTATGTKSYLKTYAPAIAAGAWGQVTGLVTVPSTSTSLQFALELPSSITSGTVDVDFASVTRATDGELVVDGSITTKSITTSGLDAAVIKVGTLDAARIGAQSITAEKLVIGQGSNVIVDPMFLSAEANAIRASKSTGTWTFGVDTGTSQNSAKTTTATTNNGFFFGLVTRSAANAANMVPVTPGDKYLLEASVYTNISAGIRWNIEYIKADGTGSYVAASPTYTASGRRKVSYEYTVPAGVVALNPVLACLTTGVTWAIDGGAIMARMTDGNLIVSGAIDGKVITGAVVQSSADDLTGIKLNSNQFVAYSTSKEETFRIDGSSGNVSLKGTIKSGSSIESASITGATITGGVVQTSVSGKKINIQNQTFGSDIRFYSPDNSKYAQMLYGTTEENAGGTVGADMFTIKGDQTGKAYITLQGSGGITIDSSATAIVQGTNNVELLTAAANENASILSDGRMLSLMHNHYTLNSQAVPAGALWGPGKPSFDAPWTRIESSQRDSSGNIYTRMAVNRGSNAANTIPTMSTWVENDVLQVHYAGLYIINWTMVISGTLPSAAYAYIARSNDARICGIDFKGGLVNISHPALRLASGERIKFKFSSNTACTFNHNMQLTRLA